MNPRRQFQRHKVLGFICLFLACVASSAQSMPGGETSARLLAEQTEPAQKTEPLACLVLDEAAPARLKLTADQTVEWQRLQQEHEHLFGDRCQATDQANPQSASALPTRQQAVSARAMQVYRKDFLDFLGGLSAEQRALLEEAARARQNSRAALEEKAIRHRLML